MFLAFVAIWFLREVKAVLFWLYLWQLKEYHIGRFLAHFHTAKGKSLLLNPLMAAKLVLLGITLVVPVAIYFALILYAGELLRKVPKPVFTKKIQFLLIAFLSILSAFVLIESLVLLLVVDLLTPILVSVVVLALQPFVVFARNRIIRQAKLKRRRLTKLKVVGITGSYGKTTTKEFLAHILGQKFQVVKTPEHANSEIGISRTILRDLTDEHDIFVCEMGAYNKGGIIVLADIVKPDIGIVAGVNEQHLALFGSMQNLLSAEGGKELVEALPQHGAAFINQSAKAKVQNYHAKCKIIVPEIPSVRATKHHISFQIENREFRVYMLGIHNAENLVLAIAVARELGMNLEEIASACETITPELGAIKTRKGVDGMWVLDSTYSANPDGVIADLDYLSLYEGKKVLVMPCLIELGSAAKDVHRRIGQKIAEVCDLAIITTKEYFGDIKEGTGQSDKVVYSQNAQEIMTKVKGASAVLLEGGKESRLQLELLALLREND